MSKFNKQTFMSVKWVFHFSICRRNLLKHLSPVKSYERIDCCNHCIAAPNNRTTRSFLINDTLFTMRNFLHQTRIGDLVKYLSPYTQLEMNMGHFIFIQPNLTHSTNAWTHTTHPLTTKQTKALIHFFSALVAV